MELLEVLEKSPGALMFTVALLGLCVGSLLNVVIHRLPKMMEAEWRSECAELDGREAPPAETYNLFTPRSACPQCKAPITALQNIPVVSWLALRGKCANCKTPISARYPMVEILGGALGVLVAWRFGYSVALAFGLAYVWVMLALTFIDLDTQLLPDDLTLPLLWLGLLANVFGTYTDLRSAVLGAVGGYMVLWLVYWGFRLIAKKEGMGFGDFKLLAAIGAWTGWQVLPVVIVISAGLGAVIGSLLLWLSKQGTDTRIPFGPYLALGGIAGLLWGREAVVAWVGRFPV
jgi:leader peptidase (prepilin peptidase)/N-methyltransferase